MQTDTVTVTRVWRNSWSSLHFTTFLLSFFKRMEMEQTAQFKQTTNNPPGATCHITSSQSLLPLLLVYSNEIHSYCEQYGRCKHWQLLWTVWTEQALTVSVNSVNCANTDRFCEKCELCMHCQLQWTECTVQALIFIVNIAICDSTIVCCTF
jgi:hypothetical protein